MGWFTDIEAVGKRVQHSDGMEGTVYRIVHFGDTEMAEVNWDDGVYNLADESEVSAID